MSGTLTVGRCDPLTGAGAVAQWNLQGNHVSAVGLIPTDDIPLAKAIRQQLLGYAANPDELVIPVTATSDPTVNGFYRVVDAHVDLPTPGRLAIGYFPWGLELERVTGYAAPVFESVLIGALRVNAFAIATGTSIAWHAVPGATAYYDTAVPNLNVDDRTGADGVMNFAYGVSNALYDAIVRWSAPPADYYDNAAKIEVGTTLRTVVGRQIEALPVNWRLSNGLVRVTPVAGGSKLDISHFDGTQWDTAKRFQVRALVAAFYTPLLEWTSISVLRNSPEVCVIRLTGSTIGRTDKEYTVDLALRRGSRTVEGVIATRTGTVQAKIQRDTAEAATAVTGGIRATANDGSANRYVLSMPVATTNDLVNGAVNSTAAAKLIPFAIGSEIGGSAAAGQDTAQNQIFQYMAAQAETVTVVAR